ncbi:MAG TPA: OmcA/MtrC family decaheme c-type cytochrome [Trebonia sp.]
MALACAFAIGQAACKGDRGPAGPAGPAGGSDGGTSALSTPSRLYAKLTAASIPNGGGKGGVPTVTYRLFKDAAYTQDAGTCAGGGTSSYAAFSPNFTIAKLIDDPENPGLKMWQSYINRLIGTIKVATNEGARGTVAGTLKDNGDGSCTYTFKSDLSAPVAPSTTAAVTETYDPAAVTRFGMQNNGASIDDTHPTFDGWVDIAPASGQVQADNPRALVATTSCNQCHRDISHHGSKRHSTEYCVTCHNQGTPDPDPTSVNSTSLDFAVMIHKIHQGGNLPSVTGTNVNGTKITGAPTNGTIVINGTDYTFVGFPQDTGNCTVCHGATSGTGVDYWKTQASIEACGACHDRIDFTASAPGTVGGTLPKTGYLAHPAGAVQDGQCTQCHGAGKQIDTTVVHRIGIPTPDQQKSRFAIKGVTSTAPGQAPAVTIAITNPAAGDANQDLATDPLWTNTANGASRLAVTLGWTVKPGEDWDNSGSGNGAAQPVSINVLGALAGSATAGGTATKNADGTYTVTSAKPVPSTAVGSGVVLIEGHPGTSTGTRYSVTNAVQYFPITDSAATPRRVVVDVQKCDKCHGLLSLHGNNRTDKIEGCVICHNAQATDISQRPGGTTLGVDGKVEQAIQLGVMIHGIHGGAHAPFTQGIVVYGFGKSVNDFRDVQFPEGNSVGHCDACHADSNPFPSVDIGIVNGITVATGGATVTDQSATTYLRTTHGAGICSSCHQATQPAAHMAQNGAAGVATVGTTVISGAGLTQGAIDDAAAKGGLGAETCTICYGRNAIADPILFHGH